MNERELFDIVRREPTEISLEKVDKWVAAFPLAPVPFDWSTIINLNSIIMTSVTTFILAGSFMLYSGDSESGPVKSSSYQLIPDTEMIQSDQPPLIEDQQISPEARATESKVSEEAKVPEAIAASPAVTVNPAEPSEPLVSAEPIKEDPVEVTVEIEVSEVSEVSRPDPPSIGYIPPIDKLEEDCPESKIAQAYSAEGRKDFTVGEFHSLSMSGSWDIIIEAGNEHSIWAEGDEDMLAKLELIEKGNGHVKIHTKKMKNWDYKKYGSITVHVTMPYFEELSVSGSGSMNIGDFDNLEDIELHIAGSGSINAEGQLIISESSEFHIAGSGDMNIDGTSPEVEVHIAGSGDFKGSDLRCSNAEVHIAGSGDVSIHCEATLDVHIAGSGDVVYSGSPKISKSIAGSGDIRHSD